MFNHKQVWHVKVSSSKMPKASANFRGKTPTLATCYPIIACLGIHSVTITCFTSCTVILICLVRLLTVLCSYFYFVLWLICLLVMTPYSFRCQLIGDSLLFCPFSFFCLNIIKVSTTLLIKAKETRCERLDLVALRWHLGTGKRLQKKFSDTLGRVLLATV